jgi:potassium-dependent mechanosensitive channel
VEIISEKVNKHIRNLNAGDFFGELSLIMGIPRTAAVRTLETTILFVVDRNVFHHFLSSYPQLADQIAEKLVERKEELFQRQQLLREMGILGEEEDLDLNPLLWIRKRMKSLFGI